MGAVRGQSKPQRGSEGANERAYRSARAAVSLGATQALIQAAQRDEEKRRAQREKVLGWYRARQAREQARQVDLLVLIEEKARLLWPEGPIPVLEGGLFFNAVAEAVGVNEKCVALCAQSLGLWPWKLADVAEAVGQRADRALCAAGEEEA